MLIDTHAHLDFSDFDSDLDDVILRARQADVERIINIGTGLESSRRAVALAEKHENIFAAVGIHPCNVEEEPENFAVELDRLLSHPKVAALGECGLDYYRPPPQADGEESSAYQKRLASWKERQKHFLIQQLDLAKKHGLGVVIHQRASWDDLLELLVPYHGSLRTVFHCFGGSAEQARRLLDNGHLVSFTGIVTFKNAEPVRDCIRALPEGSFMVETDCPYLAPVPHRGKRCEPAHVRIVAETIAKLRNEAFEQIIETTGKTAEKFFRLN
ncbi:MAG: TatD family hydrolase [Methylacidiphilales bacterium]|nr:TatD family hydrolase [Candidatus Methylacidiphilales bacterium]